MNKKKIEIDNISSFNFNFNSYTIILCNGSYFLNFKFFNKSKTLISLPNK